MTDILHPHPDDAARLDAVEAPGSRVRRLSENETLKMFYGLALWVAAVLSTWWLAMYWSAWALIPWAVIWVLLARAAKRRLQGWRVTRVAWVSGSVAASIVLLPVLWFVAAPMFYSLPYNKALWESESTRAHVASGIARWDFFKGSSEQELLRALGTPLHRDSQWQGQNLHWRFMTTGTERTGIEKLDLIIHLDDKGIVCDAWIGPAKWGW